MGLQQRAYGLTETAIDGWARLDFSAIWCLWETCTMMVLISYCGLAWMAAINIDTTFAHFVVGREFFCRS